MSLAEIFAKECREEVKYYRNRAAECKVKGCLQARRRYLIAALRNRASARKWAAAV